MHCPICGAKVELTPQTAGIFPFCGVRCREIDLGRWLDERYQVPAQPRRVADEADSPLSSTDLEADFDDAEP